MTGKDLQLINEKYHQMLTKKSRRDFLKQLMGTIAASAVEMKNELMQLSSRNNQKGWLINIDFIDQNQWQKIVSPIVGINNAARYASQIKTAIKNKQPIKIDDRLAKQIVSVVQTDTSMGNMGMWNNYTINSEIDKVINDLQKRVSNQEAASQFKQKILDAFANQKASNGATMLPAGDIVSYSANKTYYAADDMIKKGMFVGDVAIEDIVKNVTTKYAHELNDVDFKADAQKAKAKDDIEYSPADYLGGAPAQGSEQHGYKLAVDNVNVCI